MRVLLALALAAVGLSGTAHAQAPCTPKDSTVSCCVKTHPLAPERCGATKLEAEEILFAVSVAMELAKPDLPEWKRACINNYVRCKEEAWSGSCYDCFRHCEGQQGEWEDNKCRPKKKGR